MHRHLGTPTVDILTGPKREPQLTDTVHHVLAAGNLEIQVLGDGMHAGHDRCVIRAARYSGSDLCGSNGLRPEYVGGGWRERNGGTDLVVVRWKGQRKEDVAVAVDLP